MQTAAPRLRVRYHARRAGRTARQSAGSAAPLREEVSAACNNAAISCDQPADYM